MSGSRIQRIGEEKREPTDKAIEVKPIFGEPLPADPSQWPQVFVLMPFAKQLPNSREIYEDHILKVAQELRLTCKRGDDFFSDKSIISEIWTAIFHSQVCIADCTGRNPNVFYEIGIAHTLGRPCILISQSLDDIPFDVKHMSTIIYEYTPRGKEKLENSLKKTLLNTVNF